MNLVILPPICTGIQVTMYRNVFIVFKRKQNLVPSVSVNGVHTTQCLNYQMIGE